MDSVHELLEHKLQVVYAGERRAVEIIQDALEDVQNEKLRNALERHLQETQQQAERVEKVFEALGLKARTSDPSTLEGLVEERRRFLREDPATQIMDAFILGASMKVEHIEIAQYEEILLLAERAGAADVVEQLRKSLEEERAALETLRGIGTDLKLEQPPREDEEAQRAR